MSDSTVADLEVSSTIPEVDRLRASIEVLTACAIIPEFKMFTYKLSDGLVRRAETWGEAKAALLKHAGITEEPTP